MSVFYDRRRWTPGNTSSASSGAPLVTAPPVPNTNHHYVGCASEGSGGRALAGGIPLYSDDMTPRLCTDHCNLQGLPLSGAEYGRECYCGLALTHGAALGSSRCTMACAGDAAQICGGPSALSVYRRNATAIPDQPGPPGTSSSAVAPLPAADPGTYAYVGCCIEGTGGRALSGGTPLASDHMTPRLCTAHCSAQGLLLSGVKYARECYCSNVLSHGAMLGSIGCTMTCAGDLGVVCGGPGALSVFRRRGPSSSASASSLSLATPPFTLSASIESSSLTGPSLPSSTSS